MSDLYSDVYSDAYGSTGGTVTLPSYLTSGPVLSVRLSTATRDVHITDALSDLTFGSTSPGGFAECTISLHRPLTFTPGEIGLFGRCYVYDGRTGRTVWEGLLQDPGRTAGPDGQVYELAAVGGQAHLQDRTAPYVIIDTSLDRLERRQFATEHPAGEKRVDEDAIGNPALWLSAHQGQTWTQNQTATMAYPHIRNAGMKLGAYDVAGDAGRITAGTWKWQTVTRSPAGTGTVDRNVDFVTAGIPGSIRTVGVSFPDGDDQLELRIQSTGAANQLPGDDTWAIFAHFTVTAKLMTKAGVERSLAGTGFAYHDAYVLSSEVVEDVLGRLLPEFDGANASVAASTYQIDQLAYPDGVTPAQVLDDVLALEAAYTYHVWESNPANDLFRFEWVAWPTAVRYEADVIDGFTSPASGNTLFNKVRVRYKDPRGLIRSVVRTQTVTALSSAGIDRIAFIDLGDEVGTAAAAIQAGDNFLADHASPLNAGRLTVTRPVLDVQAGRMVQPYEIRPGNLIRVRGVESYPDSLNASSRDGLTVFKVAATSYSASDAAAELELDTYSPSVARAIAALKKKPPVRRR